MLPSTTHLLHSISYTWRNSVIYLRILELNIRFFTCFYDFDAHLVTILAAEPSYLINGLTNFICHSQSSGECITHQAFYLLLFQYSPFLPPLSVGRRTCRSVNAFNSQIGRSYFCFTWYCVFIQLAELSRFFLFIYRRGMAPGALYR